MRLIKYWPWLVTVSLIALVFIFKQWQIQQDKPIQTAIKGPAVILFRGDNSPGCRAIHHLVDQAAMRYQRRITVVQTDWSQDNPLIQQYQVHFLPTVVFIDDQGREIGRTVGESSAMQKKLTAALEKFEQRVLQ